MSSHHTAPAREPARLPSYSYALVRDDGRGDVTRHESRRRATRRRRPRADDGGYGGTGQTRTRYPTGRPAAVYGGARRRPLVLAEPGHGGRRRRPADRRDRLREPRRRRFLTSTAPPPGQRSGTTAATPASPRHPPRPPASSRSRRRTADIPAGFAHDRPGRAERGGELRGGAGLRRHVPQATSRHEIVDTLYTAAGRRRSRPRWTRHTRPTSSARLGLDADGNAPEGSTFVSRTVPIGTKAMAYGAPPPRSRSGAPA